MKKQRLFVAVNLPEEVRGRLAEFQNTWQGDFPARWVKPENLHLTLVFLGYVWEENIPILADALKEGSRGAAPFPLELSETVYGPTLQKPRMIWAKLAESQALAALHKNLKREFDSLPFRLHREERGLNPHLTLCRFNSINFRESDIDALPDIRAELKKSFVVESLELMESKLKRGGAEYSVLQSIRLLA